MRSGQLNSHCQLDASSQQLLEFAMHELNFSARAHDHILQLARTLAERCESENIRPEDILDGDPISLADPQTIFLNASWG